MRKFLVIMSLSLILVSIIAYTSCGDDSDEATTATPTVHRTSIPISTGGNGDFIRGDANEDGEVNMGDTSKAERIILGLDPATAGADANQDGVVDIRDVTVMEKIILGIE